MTVHHHYQSMHATLLLSPKLSWICFKAV